MTETSASTSRIKAIGKLGQQIWLDNLSRELISTGTRAAWIRDDGIQGATSNPSIFYNAIRSDAAYQASLPALRQSLSDPEARFEALVLPDVQHACVKIPATEPGIAALEEVIFAGINVNVTPTAPTAKRACRSATASKRPRPRWPSWRAMILNSIQLVTTC